MTNPFNDQEKFMTACDQSVKEWNNEQFNMYVKLIDEERTELQEAIDACDSKEILDALTDILVVTIGAMHSAGYNAEGAWNEVMRTNFAKINEVTGKVNKREDGKVLKPVGWMPPELGQYLSK